MIWDVGHEVRMSGQQLPQQRLVRDRVQVVTCRSTAVAMAGAAAANAAAHGFVAHGFNKFVVFTLDRTGFG